LSASRQVGLANLGRPKLQGAKGRAPGVEAAGAGRAPGQEGSREEDCKEANGPSPQGFAPLSAAGRSRATVRFCGVKYLAATRLTSSGVTVASTRECSST